MRNPSWSDTENGSICFAYCIMLDAQDRGIKFNKSQIRRELIGTDERPGELYNRSHGSIEAKLMNCTAAALQLGMPTLKGYKAAPNFQASLKTTLAECWRKLSSYEAEREEYEQVLGTVLMEKQA